VNILPAEHKFLASDGRRLLTSRIRLADDALRGSFAANSPVQGNGAGEIGLAKSPAIKRRCPALLKHESKGKENCHEEEQNSHHLLCRHERRSRQRSRNEGAKHPSAGDTVGKGDAEAIDKE
jgi:hypothetical protein